MKKLIAIAMALALLLTMVVSAPVTAQSTKIHVPDDYATIQAAVDNATAGDTIIVHEGTYEENVEVHRDDLTICAASGEDMPEVYGDNGAVFLIIADGVTLEGFMVTSEWGIGIALHDNASNNRVIGNYVSAYNNTGIDVIDGSHDNLIKGNEVVDSEIGIELVDAHDNDVVGNEVSGSSETGIALADGADDNEVIGNDVSGSDDFGIKVEGSSNSLIKGNDVSYCHVGIRLGGAIDNQVTGNEISNSGYDGIQLAEAEENEVIRNNVSDTAECGIFVNVESNDNLIEGNVVTDSGKRHGKP